VTNVPDVTLAVVCHECHALNLSRELLILSEYPGGVSATVRL